MNFTTLNRIRCLVFGDSNIKSSKYQGGIFLAGGGVGNVSNLHTVLPTILSERFEYTRFFSRDETGPLTITHVAVDL